MPMIDLFNTYWPLAASLLVGAVSVVLVISVILMKRDESAAIAWVGLILLAPVLGAIAYLLFGINRIRRRAERARPRTSTTYCWSSGSGVRGSLLAPADELEPESPRHIRRKLIDALGTFPTVQGNAVRVLQDGDEVFPAMLEAIETAQYSVALASYIFKPDDVGVQFINALERAQQRGVEVRVLLDGAGQMYTIPTAASALRACGVRHARYLHSFWPWRMPYLNLRNHRKILVVDGRTGFTGGINISMANLVKTSPWQPVRDLHFVFNGPVVTQLMEVFADDWAFTTGELLDGLRWFPVPEALGEVDARVITSGPHEPIERMRWILHAAISEAHSRICIMTPYLLPDEIIVAELRLAAIRGVEIDIIIPKNSNLFFVDWAVRARIDELLVDGCRIWFGPRPFNHAKLMLVDDDWALVGSSNWDPRSLRLNFELNVECLSETLINELDRIFERERRASRAVTLDEMRSRSIPVRLRDGIARLFTPYL
jgi:cardiolipin synthase